MYYAIRSEYGNGNAWVTDEDVEGERGFGDFSKAALFTREEYARVVAIEMSHKTSARLSILSFANNVVGAN